MWLRNQLDLRMKAQPVYFTGEVGEWLKKVQQGKLEVTGENICKALRLRAYVQVIDLKQNVVSGAIGTDKVSGFRITERGRALLAKETGVQLPINLADPPKNIKWWANALKRWARQCPKGFFVTYSNDELRVLVADNTGKVKDDEAHRLVSVRVPWHSS